MMTAGASIAGEDGLCFLGSLSVCTFVVPFPLINTQVTWPSFGTLILFLGHQPYDLQGRSVVPSRVWLAARSVCADFLGVSTWIHLLNLGSVCCFYQCRPVHFHCCCPCDPSALVLFLSHPPAEQSSELLSLQGSYSSRACEGCWGLFRITNTVKKKE